MNRALAGQLLSLLATLVACTSTPTANPVPMDGVDAAVDVVAADTQIGEDAGPPDLPMRRRVMTRSAFGNLDHTGNLMLDGDFEWSGTTSSFSQTPWRVINRDMEPAALSFETGGTCRSGLRCVTLAAGDSLLGEGVSPAEGELDISLWAKPPGGSCGVITVTVLSAMTQRNMAQVAPESDNPNTDGWCHFRSITPNLDEAVYVYVEIGRLMPVLTSMLVDDVVLRPSDGLSPRMLRPVPEDLRRRIMASVAVLRRTRRFDR